MAPLTATKLVGRIALANYHSIPPGGSNAPLSLSAKIQINKRKRKTLKTN